MEERVLSSRRLLEFREYLIMEEKSEATVEKYCRDTERFMFFASQKPVTKDLVIQYKQSLQEEGYAIRSINSMLASINSLLVFLGWSDCKVKSMRCQRQIYCPEDKELTKNEYKRLLDASKNQEQLNLIIQTICSTGIRISELKYFTVEAVKNSEVIVRCKNKTRTILVPVKLKRLLLNYAKRRKINDGTIFISRRAKPLDRSYIWALMKRLCKIAAVKATKVFPHNLRKLFARTFYNLEKDIAKLADILGHSSVETTRIYIMASGNEHRQQIERLGLII